MTPGPRPRVRVPASSANLGPGFDAFAVALDRHVSVTVLARAEARVRTTGDGAGELSEGDDNLVWRAAAAYCDWAGVSVPDVSLNVDNAIPLERGLGSSAAATVAGVALARALTGTPAKDQDLIDLAAALEGHADNAAAAVLGGLVVCSDGTAHRLEPTSDLTPVLCVPVGRQSTEAARGLLPEQVPLAAAAANGARAAMVLAGLAGAMAFDPRAMRDVLHEPSRFPAMGHSGRLVEALRATGVGACLSGAGPSVLAIVRSDDDQALATVRAAASEGFTVEAWRWDRSGAGVAWINT